jgi:hypothetical protein
VPRPDIIHEIVPEDNPYLIVHKSSGFEYGDDDNLQAVLDFISNRASRPSAENLHAIW